MYEIRVTYDPRLFTVLYCTLVQLPYILFRIFSSVLDPFSDVTDPEAN
jgi:hypothetical protein